MAPRFIVGCFDSIFCFDNDDGFIHQSSIGLQCFSYDTSDRNDAEISIEFSFDTTDFGKRSHRTDAAGQVIQAFGQFMMSGNPVIGVIVFAILVIVNFIVITKGSGRIAEVSARFSLDAMPGKQMAIDADLSSGLITEDEARSRREDLSSESSFFGAMDGASKFVRGDAIAGLLITIINVLGGIIIGVLQQDLTVSQASQTYTLLTVGDGW